MKLLLDTCVWGGARAHLEAAGHDIVWTGDWAKDPGDAEILAAFAFLDARTRHHGDVLPRELLAEGFLFDDQRVPLLGPQGIFKPKVMLELPLSITTVPIVEGRDRPYADELSPDNLLSYRYRGTDPGRRDNVALRLAMQRQAPLVFRRPALSRTQAP